MYRSPRLSKAKRKKVSQQKRPPCTRKVCLSGHFGIPFEDEISKRVINVHEHRSAMHWAAATGQGRSLELLMESMTIEEQLQEVNRTDADGKTPLSLAAEAGVAGKDAFVFLIKKGGEYGSVLPTILLNLHVQSPERHTWAGQFPSPPTASRTRSRLSLSSTFT